jgi:D-alanyl-D-alanine carboxypeptidase
VILQLVDEGKLALGDTVADIDPEIAGRFPAFADITLRQLLAMRSGVSDYLNTPKGIAPDVVADPQRVWTADELIARGIEVGVKRPGTPGYSTTNYIVLQEIAESIGGAPLRELIANRIASPLGLEATLLPPDDDTALTDPGTSGTIATACAEELEEDGAEAPVGTDTTDWNASYGQGGGGMQSSLEELGVWAASGLGDDLLTPATTSARTAGGASIGDGVTYGLGLQVVGDFLGHGGEAFGWQALALHDPAGDRTVVVAVNACGAGLGPYAIAAAAFPDAGIEESIFGG